MPWHSADAKQVKNQTNLDQIHKLAGWLSLETLNARTETKYFIFLLWNGKREKREEQEKQMQ